MQTKDFKRHVRLTLQAVGLSGRNGNSAFPEELDAETRTAIQTIQDRGFSMSKTESLFATALACAHLLKSGPSGDFVECGVWRGGHSLLAASILQAERPARSIWLYDTFAGMTEPTDADINEKGVRAIAKYRRKMRADGNDWCFASLGEVQANFASLGLLGPQIRFVKGDVAESLRHPENLPNKIALLRLDTDWYESTNLILETLYPRLQPGGIIIVDDYGNWAGQKRAVEEYFSSRPRPFLSYINKAGRIGVKV